MIHQFETHSNKEALQADLKQNRAFNPFSERSKEMIYCMRNMEYFKICENTHQNTMFQLYDILAERYCILHMRNMLTTFRQSSKTQQWPLRCSVDSQLRHQEGTVPWDTPQEHRGRESTMQPMSLNTLIRWVKNSLIRHLWWIEHVTWIAKNVSLWPRKIPCIRSQTLVAAQHRSRTWKTADWLGTWDNFPLQIDSIYWNSPESFINSPFPGTPVSVKWASVS